MHYTIITGGSRGLGAAFVRAFTDKNHRVYAISRSKPADPCEWIEADLSDAEQTENSMNQVFETVEPGDLSSLVLINNAGVLGPIGQIEQADRSQITTNLSTNLNAPAILTSRFIEQSQQLAIPKWILNITSGAASNPYDGWSLYCAAKAGLDLFTRCVAKEQARAEHPVSIVNINPGVMDTRMQALIRKSSEDQFPTLQRFLNLYEENQLTPPETIANEVIKALEQGSLVSGSTYKVADWLQ